METRANYILIGAFTIAGFLGILGFFLWFARVELDRQFDYYDVVFTSVSGLSNASEVRFAGLPVGSVVDVRLAPDASGRVIVRLEVNADTPVRTSSVATIETLGVTGVSFVGISAGDAGDPLLKNASEEPIPRIPAGRSVLQSLTEDAPAILEEILEVSRSVSEILGPANQDRVSAILSNVESSSAGLEQALDDFSSVTNTIAVASEDIRIFTSRLEDISRAATTTLETADTTLRQVTELAERAETTLDVGDAALESGRRTLDSANAFIGDELPDVVDNLEQTLATLRNEIERVGEDATAVLDEFRRTGAVATARLEEAEQTIASANRVLDETSSAMAAVDSAATEFDSLVAGDGTALVSEARVFVSDANELVNSAIDIAETDLPEILDDIRAATDTASRVIDSVGTDLSAAAERTDEIVAEAGETLKTVTDTFENANETLSRLNTALETGDSALLAAEETFTTANRVLNDDVGDMVASLRETLARLDEAIASVSEDVPAITSDLRETAERANAAFAEVEGTARSFGPPLRSFAADGLPQYTRLASETRNLVANLQQLVRQIERDPARYFLGGERPVFRR